MSGNGQTTVKHTQVRTQKISQKPQEQTPPLDPDTQSP